MTWPHRFKSRNFKDIASNGTRVVLSLLTFAKLRRRVLGFNFWILDHHMLSHRVIKRESLISQTKIYFKVLSTLKMQNCKIFLILMWRSFVMNSRMLCHCFVSWYNFQNASKYISIFKFSFSTAILSRQNILHYLYLLMILRLTRSYK